MPVQVPAPAFPVAAGVAGPVLVRGIGVVQAGRFAVRVVRQLLVRLRPVPLSKVFGLGAVQAVCLVEVITVMSLCVEQAECQVNAWLLMSRVVHECFNAVA